MPSGVHIDRVLKERLYNYLIIKKISVEDCFDLLFDKNENVVTLAYLKRLRSFFQSQDLERISIYLENNRRGGRKRCLSIEDEDMLKSLACIQPKLPYRKIGQKLSEMIGGNFPVFAASTVAKNVKRLQISSKNVTTESAYLNHEERNSTLKHLAVYPTERMHNCDESLAAMKKFQAKVARSSIGERAICIQWSIADRCRIYSVIGDYTSEGWSTWRIVYSNVNHLTFEAFIKEDIGQIWINGDVLLYDGAPIHLC
jgi:hypothetical protein